MKCTIDGNRITIEDAEIRFTNFAGKATQYNSEGRRNFVLVIYERDIANELKQMGFNVNMRASRDPEDPPYYTLTVNVSYKFEPGPTIKVIDEDEKGNKSMVLYSEENVGLIDRMRISSVDMVITASPVKRIGMEGMKMAFLDEAYILTEGFRYSSPFENKYKNFNEQF